MEIVKLMFPNNVCRPSGKMNLTQFQVSKSPRLEFGNGTLFFFLSLLILFSNFFNFISNSQLSPKLSLSLFSLHFLFFQTQTLGQEREKEKKERTELEMKPFSRERVFPTTVHRKLKLAKILSVTD